MVEGLEGWGTSDEAETVSVSGRSSDGDDDWADEGINETSFSLGSAGGWRGIDAISGIARPAIREQWDVLSPGMIGHPTEDEQCDDQAGDKGGGERMGVR